MGEEHALGLLIKRLWVPKSEQEAQRREDGSDLLSQTHGPFGNGGNPRLRPFEDAVSKHLGVLTAGLLPL